MNFFTNQGAATRSFDNTSCRKLVILWADDNRRGTKLLLFHELTLNLINIRLQRRLWG